MHTLQSGPCTPVSPPCPSEDSDNARACLEGDVQALGDTCPSLALPCLYLQPSTKTRGKCVSTQNNTFLFSKGRRRSSPSAVLELMTDPGSMFSSHKEGPGAQVETHTLHVFSVCSVGGQREKAQRQPRCFKQEARQTHQR